MIAIVQAQLDKEIATHQAIGKKLAERRNELRQLEFEALGAAGAIDSLKDLLKKLEADVKQPASA